MKLNPTAKPLTALGGHARQGDTLLRRIESNSPALTKKEKVILAYGEVTGHSHRFESGATAFADEESELADQVVVQEPIAQLVHEEHDTIEFPSGVYESLKQVEYSPKEVRRVAD